MSSLRIVAVILALALVHCGGADTSSRDAGGLPVELRGPTEIQFRSAAGEGGSISLGDRAVVLSSDDEGDCMLWVSDGTASGTQRLGAVTPTLPSCARADLIAGPSLVRVGNSAYFLWSGQSGVVAGTLWRTDGTAAGTRAIPASNPWDGLVPLADRVLLLGQLSPGECSLAVYLPDTDQVQTLADVGPCSTRIPGFSASWSYGGHQYVEVSLDSPSTWATDGTPTGTYWSTEVPQLTRGGVVQGDRFDFLGNGLYVTDGTPAGTHLVEAAGDAGAFQYPDDLFVLGDTLLYTRNQVTGGTWQTTAFAALGADQLTPQTLFATGGRFAGWVGALSGSALYLWSDGIGQASLQSMTSTSAAPQQVVALGTDGSVEQSAPLGSREVFATGSGVWSTDGTAAGTAQLTGAYGEAPLAVLDGGLIVDDGSSLWWSDGTAAGTHRFRNLFSAPPPALIALSARACYLDGSAVICTDGTDAGTEQVDTGVTAGVPPAQVFASSGRAGLYLEGSPEQIAFLDGTAAGTRTFAWNEINPPQWVTFTDHAAVVVGSSGLESFDLDSGAMTTLAAGVTMAAPVAGGRIAMVSAVDGGQELSSFDLASHASAPLAQTPEADWLVSDGTLAWMGARSDAGTTWTATDGVAVFPAAPTGSAVMPIRAVGGVLLVAAFSGANTDLDALVPGARLTRLATVAEFPAVSATAVGRLIAVTESIPDAGLVLFDPSIGRAWQPDPAFHQVTLPSSTSAAGMIFSAARGDGGVGALEYSVAQDAVLDLDAGFSAVSGGVALDGGSLFWARDLLGWTLWRAR